MGHNTSDMQGLVWDEPDLDTRRVAWTSIWQRIATRRNLETMQVQPLVLSVLAPLSLWLALSTISVASHCSVASLSISSTTAADNDEP